MHGDDFVTVGTRQECRWLKEVLEKRFEITTKVIGDSGGEAKEERILNRVIGIPQKDGSLRRTRDMQRLFWISLICLVQKG